MKIVNYTTAILLATLGSPVISIADHTNPSVSKPEEKVLTCKLSCEDLTKRSAIFKELLKSSEETIENEDGYSLRFPGTNEWTVKLIDFIRAERICCNFFKFGLTFEPNLGPIKLFVGGSPEIKEFMESLIK